MTRNFDGIISFIGTFFAVILAPKLTFKNLKWGQYKTMIYLATLLSFLIVIISGWMNASAYAAVYYIKYNGNDKASGLSDTKAWKTIAKVNDYAENPGFANGDSILFNKGDTFSSMEALGQDGGGAINWGTISGFTIDSYGTGADPIFDGNTITGDQVIDIDASGITNLTIQNITINGMDGNYNQLIDIHDVNGVTISNIAIDARSGSSSFPRPDHLIRLTDIVGDILVEDSTITNCYPTTWNDWVGNDCVGLRLQHNFGGGDPKTVGTITIEGNTITGMYSDSIAIEKIQSTNFYIRNNTLGNYAENSLDSKGSHNWQYYNNIVYRTWGNTGGSSPGAASALVIHDSKDNAYETEDAKIYNNYFYDEDKAGVRIEEARRLKVYQNYFKDVARALQANWCMGLDFENNVIVATAAPVGVNEALYVANSVNNDDIKLINNSIYITHADYAEGIYWSAIGGQTGGIIRNNAVMIEAGSSGYPLYMKDGDSSNNFPEVGHNIWYNADHANRVYWDRKTFSGSEQNSWQSTGHSSGLFLDPIFYNPTADDFKLNANSPCLECGADVKLIKFLPISTSKLSSPNHLKIRK